MRSRCSRGRVKLKVSKQWTTQKCHSAGQRNLDDDDDDDDDDDGDGLESVFDCMVDILQNQLVTFLN